MDVVTGVVIAAVTALVLLGAGVAVGFVALFRQRGGAAASAITSAGSTIPAGSLGSDAELSLTAGSALVQADDAVRSADIELGFAIAQFGADRARAYGESIALARAKVAEAFRLNQALDDDSPDSDRERRQWTLQIIALCEQAQKILAEQDAAFAGLRAREADATHALAQVREQIAELQGGIPAARETLSQLRDRYEARAVEQAVTAVDDAEASLASAIEVADGVAGRVTATGTGAVSDELARAADAVNRAFAQLGILARTARDLTAANDALSTLQATARADVDAARAQRDAAPDPDTARAIIEAMAAVDTALGDPEPTRDPVASLDRIGGAIEALDRALASARNQADRLDHARAAYQGTLVSAASQIAVARDLIDRHGGDVQARTRLAEAERLYALAQVETDPVTALDVIRSAVTNARDADALARYRG